MPTTGEIVGTEKKLEENKMFKKLKDKKGFTLVELIVVLVILAILAALLVPALTGYIDRANNEKIIAETRSCVMAAQTIASESYGASTPVKALTEASTDYAGAETDVNYAAAIAKLAEVKGSVTKVTVTNGKVTSLTYQDTNNKTCEYSSTDNKYTPSK